MLMLKVTADTFPSTPQTNTFFFFLEVLFSQYCFVCVPMRKNLLKISLFRLRVLNKKFYTLKHIMCHAQVYSTVQYYLK